MIIIIFVLRCWELNPGLPYARQAKALETDSQSLLHGFLFFYFGLADTESQYVSQAGLQ